MSLPKKADRSFAVVKIVMLMIFASSFAAHASLEFYAGEPVELESLQIVPNYLTGVQTDKAPAGAATGKNSVLLEADVHAMKGEAHGFPEGAWIPYLTITFKLSKAGTAFSRQGTLYPMTAKNGPHYANSVDMNGPGIYHLAYTISPPDSNGFIRHIDKATGVSNWWAPITANWIFTYPGKSR